jgi:RND family efflux transporter MFP subunit
MKLKSIIFLSLTNIFFIFSCKRQNIAELPPETNNLRNNIEKQKKNDFKEKNNVQNNNNLKNKNNSDKNINPISTFTNNENTLEVSLNQLPATVYGTNTSQLGFRVNGYLSSILVKNGQFVKKGDVIAKLDSSIMFEQLKLAQLALEQAKNTEHFALLALKRTQTLNQRQATTQIALEQAESSWQNARIAVKLADSNLRIAQINYNDNTLIAPFSGYIFNLTAWVGSYVSATSPLVTLASLENLQIQLPVPQTFENKFNIGDKFPFTTPNQKGNGTFLITNIIPYVDQNTKTYLIVGTPTQTDKQLMSGELILIKLK